ncbi:MAG: TetR/AcrR family transcriptional regulator [Planctomycetota bacterium]
MSTKKASKQRAPAVRRRPGVEAQRRAVLEATWRVLGRQHLEDTRVEDVLREAGVSRQTFYRCFKSLDEAFAGVHEAVGAFLQEALQQALAGGAAPEAWLDQVIGAIVDAAVAAGPALAAIEREETRPGSPFYGARARRQEALAGLLQGWFQARYGLEASPWRARAALMAVNQLCVAVCDPARASADDVAAAKDAAAAVARGLLLLEGASAGLWTVEPAKAQPPELSPQT